MIVVKTRPGLRTQVSCFSVFTELHLRTFMLRCSGLEHANKAYYFPEPEISVFARLLWEEDAPSCTSTAVYIIPTRRGPLIHIQLRTFCAPASVGFQAWGGESSQLDFCPELFSLPSEWFLHSHRNLRCPRQGSHSPLQLQDPNLTVRANSRILMKENVGRLSLGKLC